MSESASVSPGPRRLRLVDVGRHPYRRRHGPDEQGGGEVAERHPLGRAARSTRCFTSRSSGMAIIVVVAIVRYLASQLSGSGGAAVNRSPVLVLFPGASSTTPVRGTDPCGDSGALASAV